MEILVLRLPQLAFNIFLLLCILPMGVVDASACRPELAVRVPAEVVDIGRQMAAWDAVRAPFWSVSGSLSLAEQLETARYLQMIGDYERAVETCKSLLASSPLGSAEHKEAAFLLGETQYYARNYAAAASSLLDFATQYPDDVRRGRAVFLAGRAYQAVGNWSQAIAQYQTYLSIDDTVASFVFELIGDCYLAARNYPATIEAYRQGLAGPIDRLMRIHLLEGIAEAQNQAGQYADLARTYDAILEHAVGGDYRAKTEYLAGRALAAAGRTEESLKRYLKVVNEYPTAYHAYLSLIELVNAGYPVNEFQRGLVDYYNGAYTPAVQAFDRYIKSAPDNYAGQAHYYKGLAYKEAGSYDLALAQFDALIESYPRSDYLGKAWIAKGQTYVAMGAPDKAAEVWRQFVELHPSEPLAPEAFWLSGQVWEEQARFEEAIYNYFQAQSRYPDFARASESLYRAGICSFRAGAYDSAIRAWQTLAENYQTSPLRPAALYWLARAFHAAGDDDNMRVALATLRESYPRNYYAVRGAEFEMTRSAKMFQRPRPTNMLLTPPTVEERMEAENWLLSWSPEQPGEGESVSELPAALAEDGRLRRGLILWTLDLTSDASAQIRSLKDTINDAPLSLYRLGLRLREEGMYRLSTSCFERVIALAPVEKQAATPTFLLKMTHPFRFNDLILAEAVKADIDPLLLLALVRQESNFEWHAESWAGAQGLMQVMPATADWIALQLGRRDFAQHLIYRPYVNVEFGVWYFDYQLSSFGEDAVAALVAYNAGPGRVKRWRTEEMAKDDDLFLEYMPLEEPRLYLEKVYSHYSIYRRLYAAG
jgi:soluble lytic murein transglycosylase